MVQVASKEKLICGVRAAQEWKVRTLKVYLFLGLSLPRDLQAHTRLVKHTRMRACKMMNSTGTTRNV